LYFIKEILNAKNGKVMSLSCVIIFNVSTVRPIKDVHACAQKYVKNRKRIMRKGETGGKGGGRRKELLYKNYKFIYVFRRCNEINS